MCLPAICHALPSAMKWLILHVTMAIWVCPMFNHTYIILWSYNMAGYIPLYHFTSQYPHVPQDLPEFNASKLWKPPKIPQFPADSPWFTCPKSSKPLDPPGDWSTSPAADAHPKRARLVVSWASRCGEVQVDRKTCLFPNVTEIESNNYWLVV